MKPGKFAPLGGFKGGFLFYENKKYSNISNSFEIKKIRDEYQKFSKNITYLLAQYLSVIQIQFFYVHNIWLLVVMHIIFK